jgi:hypothetical protein
MLQTISSPRAEGASPPLKDVPYSKKSSYTLILAVTLGDSQLNVGSSSYRYRPTLYLKAGLIWKGLRGSWARRWCMIWRRKEEVEHEIGGSSEEVGFGGEVVGSCKCHWKVAEEV